MKKLDFTSMKLINAKANGGHEYFFPNSGAFAVTEFKKGTFMGEKVAEENYLVMDVTNLTDSTCTVMWRFWESDAESSDMCIRTAVLPRLKTRLALPFSVLNGKILFMPRTPGKLKTVVQGKPIHLDEIHKFALNTAGNPGGITLQIDDMFISESEPDYPLETVAMVDELGQKNLTDWVGKTKSVAELKENLRREAEDTTERPLPMRSRFGGWTGKRFDATGFFRVEHDGRRYWLVDPDGYAFFSTGFDDMAMNGDCNLRGIECLCRELPPKSNECWSHGRSEKSEGEPHSFNFIRYNVSRAFGEGYHDTWSALMRRRMISWGMNTTACWSDPEYIKKSKLPYVIIGRGYPTTSPCIFRDFPDVFSPEFEKSANEWAKFLLPHLDDENLIGYFMSNEPHWAFVDDLNIAAVTLESPEQFCSKDYIINTVRAKYAKIEKLNEAWGTSFTSFESLSGGIDTRGYKPEMYDDLMDCSAEMIRMFIKIPALAAKKVDKNHLNLGIRYAWLSNKVLASGCEYVDVFSFNCYDMDPTERINSFAAMTGKPLMIGEFHFGALDRGLDAPGLRCVASQEARGVAYRRYMHRAASNPMCVGAHYFTLYDQGYLGRHDGENYQIGALDVCSHPYSEFIDGIISTNTELYDIANGTKTPTDEIAEEVGSLMR